MQTGLEVAGFGGLAVGCVALSAWIVAQVKERRPERREFKRRRLLSEQGRLGDAFITEATESIIYYEYTVQGVQYAASQEIGALRAKLPAEPERLIGLASIKYAVRNPANSMVICEEWSGLRGIAKAHAAGAAESPGSSDARPETGAR
jgi:hypothetical protein